MSSGPSNPVSATNGYDLWAWVLDEIEDSEWDVEFDITTVFSYAEVMTYQYRNQPLVWAAPPAGGSRRTRRRWRRRYHLYGSAHNALIRREQQCGGHVPEQHRCNALREWSPARLSGLSAQQVAIVMRDWVGPLTSYGRHEAVWAIVQAYQRAVTLERREQQLQLAALNAVLDTGLAQREAFQTHVRALLKESRSRGRVPPRPRHELSRPPVAPIAPPLN